MTDRPYGQRGVISLKPWRKNSDGLALCRWCDTPIPKDSRRKAWCSDKCVDEWRERGDWSHIRKKIIERDKVCQMCGDRRFEKSYDVRERPEQPAFTAIQRARWEVDHIVAVEDGGTDDPANLRLLCRPCHKDRTALQRREKAAKRRGQLGLAIS